MGSTFCGQSETDEGGRLRHRPDFSLNIDHPWVQTRSKRRRTVPREVPFALPPRLSPVKPAEFNPSGETAEEVQTEDTHRGSLSVSSRYPVGSLLSALYPSSPLCPVTAPPAVLCPQICFSVQYRHRSEQLLVSVLRLSNLPPSLHSCRALIELRLLPDDRRPLQAKARNTGPHPEFSDCLVFQVSPVLVPASVLVLVVLSVGPEGRRSVGRVEVPLRGDLCHTGRVQWRALQTQPQVESAALGELLISLSYSPSVQRLRVGVTRARGLLLDTGTGVVQVSLQSPSQLKSKQGPVLKTECRPAPVQTESSPAPVQTESRPGPVQTESRPGPEDDLNQIYSFKLKRSQLDQSCVRIQVLQKYKGTDGGVPVGAVVLGSLMFSRGSQVDHWMEMLSAPGDTVERWHPLGPAA